MIHFCNYSTCAQRECSLSNGRCTALCVFIEVKLDNCAVHIFYRDTQFLVCLIDPYREGCVTISCSSYRPVGFFLSPVSFCLVGSSFLSLGSLIFFFLFSHSLISVPESPVFSPFSGAHCAGQKAESPAEEPQCRLQP